MHLMLLTEIANKTGAHTKSAIDRVIERPILATLNGWFHEPGIEKTSDFVEELQHKVSALANEIHEMGKAIRFADESFVRNQREFMRDRYHGLIAAACRGEDMWSKENKTYPRDKKQVERFLQSFDYLAQESARGNEPNSDEYIASAHKKLSKIRPSQ